MSYHFLEVGSFSESGLSFWQSTIWMNILRDSHQVHEVFYFGDPQSCYLLVEIRSIGGGFFGAFSLGVSSFQVQMDDWNHFREALFLILRQKGVIFFQIEPLEDAGINLDDSYEPYKKFLTPHTRILDLTLSPDELLSQMHEKGRYNIRYAQKKGVVIEKVSFTPENLDTWMGLLSATLERDGFSGNSYSYYETFLQSLSRNERGGLYFARIGDRIIAGGIFVFTPLRAFYYYGASSSDPDDRKTMASYLLQWHVIQEAQKQGILIYDFLGVADPSRNDDPLSGVSQFKSRFGGSVVSLPKKGLFSLSWKYSLFRVLQAIKKRLFRVSKV